MLWLVCCSIQATKTFSMSVISLFYFLITCVFTGVALLISFKNFFFAFTTWLTSTRGLILVSLDVLHAFPDGAVVKNPSANAGDVGDVSISGLGRSPGGRKWKTTPVFLPGESHGQRPGGLQSMESQESDTTEHNAILTD